MIQTDVELTAAETMAIEGYAREDADAAGQGIDHVDVWLEGDELCMKTYFESDIRRVRRITGYLSTIDRFNDGKKAELANRQTHDSDLDDLRYDFR
jgi:anaerobic ribonucleoside-triphosphate reductase activating protein